LLMQKSSEIQCHTITGIPSANDAFG